MTYAALHEKLAHEVGTGLIDWDTFVERVHALTAIENDDCLHPNDKIHRTATGEWECALCGEIIERD